MLANWLSEPDQTVVFNSGMGPRQGVVKRAMEGQPGDMKFNTRWSCTYFTVAK